MPFDRDTAACRCSMTRITLTGPPIHSVTCYCTSCRTAAQGFERDLGAPPTVTPQGGVDYVLYRKDRAQLAESCPPLNEHRLTSDTPTRRLVASCCGSPMVVDFTPGHWLSVYSGRLPPPAPEPRIGIMTRDRPADAAPLAATPPAYPTQPPAFFFKLLGAWAAMGFRRPKLTW